MDKLAKRLRDDAANIDVDVSDELENRIQASLVGVEPEPPKTTRRASRPGSFWWASSLTGIAVAVGVIALLNLQQPAAPPTDVDAQTVVFPAIQWHAEPAVLTAPLEQEIEDLRSDLERAEEAVKQDIERLF